MLTVVVTTYIPKGEIGERRLLYLHEAIDGLWKHLVGVECYLHIADDSEEAGYIDLNHFPFSLGGYTCSGHRGIGASLNLALNHISGNWLYVTDDWLLDSTLDLIGPIKLLDDYSYDVVRIGPVHPNLACTTRFNRDVGWWLDINNGRYAFATRPFVATKAFVERIGPFKEHVDAYECEFDYAWRCEGGKAKVAAIMEYNGIWTHLGEDYSVGLHDKPS